MKTNYDSPEDQALLRTIFHRASMQTEAIYHDFELFRQGILDLHEIILFNLELRAKLYECMGEEDFNEHSGFHDQIRKRVAEGFKPKKDENVT